MDRVLLLFEKNKSQLALLQELTFLTKEGQLMPCDSKQKQVHAVNEISRTPKKVSGLSKEIDFLSPFHDGFFLSVRLSLSPDS